MLSTIAIIVVVLVAGLLDFAAVESDSFGGTCAEGHSCAAEDFYPPQRL